MYKYKLTRSKRKSISIEITQKLELIVRAPNQLPQQDIDSFVLSREAWIEKHIEIMRKRTEQYPTVLTEEEIALLIEKAKHILPSKLEYYSKLMHLYPTAVKITGAKTRFGSCSSRDSICFSYMLMQYPDKAIDYVIVHELAHIKHKSHSKEFYALIEQYMPDYREREKLLKSV